MRSRIPSIISVALAAGCSGGSETCGPQGAGAFALVAAGTGVSLTYGDLVASQNNDCPAAGAPAGVVSLTITGKQMGTAGLVTLCVPRPDELATTAAPLGSGVELVDFTGSDPTCSYELDMVTPPTGTATAHGLCDNGSNAAGFALDFDGGLSFDRTCGTTVDTVAVTLTGDVAVTVGG